MNAAARGNTTALVMATVAFMACFFASSPHRRRGTGLMTNRPPSPMLGP
jgi:hypothetical protein